MTADMSYDEWKLASPPEEEDDGRGHEYGRPQPEPPPALGYPAGWPTCPGCGLPALDGHITCGGLQCDEGGRRP